MIYKSSQSLCSLKDFGYFCIELFDSKTTQNTEKCKVAKSLPLFFKYPVKCLSFK